MQIKVAAIGQRMPRWVSEAWTEYVRRMPSVLNIELREIPAAHRGRNADIGRARREESAALLAAVQRDAHVVALEQKGQPWTTEELASRLEGWMGDGRDVCILIGGPDGMSRECLQAVGSQWSLGPLTLPHPLVRVILAEQLYRAWSIISKHPYHRG